MNEAPRSPNARTRASDRRFPGRLLHWSRKRYQDLWLFIISGLLLWAAIISQNNASQAKVLGGDIQKSRLDSCSAQNARRKDTIDALNSIYSGAIAHERSQIATELKKYGHTADIRLIVQIQEQSIATGEGPTLYLIDALVPHQNCQKVVLGKNTTKSYREA